MLTLKLSFNAIKASLSWRKSLWFSCDTERSSSTRIENELLQIINYVEWSCVLNVRFEMRSGDYVADFNYGAQTYFKWKTRK